MIYSDNETVSDEYAQNAVVFTHHWQEAVPMGYKQESTESAGTFNKACNQS